MCWYLAQAFRTTLSLPRMVADALENITSPYKNCGTMRDTTSLRLVSTGVKCENVQSRLSVKNSPLQSLATWSCHVSSWLKMMPKFFFCIVDECNMIWSEEKWWNDWRRKYRWVNQWCLGFFRVYGQTVLNELGRGPYSCYVYSFRYDVNFDVVSIKMDTAWNNLVKFVIDENGKKQRGKNRALDNTRSYGKNSW
jgi:hypothetical protein